MCGVAGYWGATADGAAVLRRMCDAIRHRGPDDEGQWLDPEAGIGLGHRRLSILDLSPLGHQPMVSASGRYVITYNGEIYNWQELRREEETHGARWRGHSDTEVLLAAIERRGLEATLRAAVGMFAIAVWDRQERALALMRDRLGEKPLYFGYHGGVLLFGSELKALRAHPACGRDIDRGAVALFLRHNYIPAPYSIYRGIHKLEPGQIARFAAPTGDPVFTRYWCARDAAVAGLAAPYPGGESEYLGALGNQLQATVRDQMVADVPLGAFLSGGVDSSLIVALMQQQSPKPVCTFTIGFHEAEWNEAGHARAVAKHLGTDHTELTVTPDDLLAVVPRLPAMYDEPFSDSSQVPTALVAALARQQVTVSLSGDGGDELFGGYARYGLGERVWARVGRIPRAVRRAAGRAISLVPAPAWDRMLTPLGTAMPTGFRGRVTGDRMHKAAELLSRGSFELLYRDLLSHWRQPEQVVLGGVEPPTALTDPARRLTPASPLSQMMYLDSVSYLPDDILVKVDRAAMAVSLESRAPLLDHRVFELAWRMPASLRTMTGGGKPALKQLLARHVPPALTDRPKMGFGVPIQHWLRGPLREWGEALLDERRLRAEGLFSPEAVRQKWDEHQAGTRDWQYLLWDVLMFQAWREAESAGC
ncbi:MAG: asparagine synthase (glutamine-hydrolyzing) [Gemmatimonadales bacterium]